MVTKEEYWEAMYELMRDVAGPTRRFTKKTGLLVKFEPVDRNYWNLNKLQRAILNIYTFMKKGKEMIGELSEPTNDEIQAELSNPDSPFSIIKRDGWGYSVDYIRKQRRIIQDKGYDVGLPNRG